MKMKKEKYITGDVVRIKGSDDEWRICFTPYGEDDVYDLERVHYNDFETDSCEVVESAIEELVERALKARLMYYKKKDEMVIEIYSRGEGWCYCYGCQFSHSKEFDEVEEPEFIHIGLLHKIVELQKWGYKINLDWRTKEDE